MKIIKQYRLLLLLISCFLSTNAQEIFVSEIGNDSNPGTKEQPLKSLLSARNKARSSGIKTIWVRSGRYTYTNPVNLDAKDNDLKISGYNNEIAIFDGASYFDTDAFKIVSDSKTLNRLHSKAKGQVYEIPVNDDKLIKLLESGSTQLSMDDIMMHVARFPNKGYVHVDNSTLDISSEVNSTDGTITQPKGPKFKLLEAIDANKWNAEIRVNDQVLLSGYYSADWLKESSPVHAVSSSGVLHLRDGSAYGMKDRNRLERIYVTKLLCELDQPGEWFYDIGNKKLFIWPFSSITKTSKIGVWAGGELINITRAKNIKIQNIIIQHASRGNGGDATIDIRSSESCEIAGVTFRYVANIQVANIIDGKKCGIKSCDIYDCSGGFRCYGGTVNRDQIIHGKNYIENCHYTQIYSKDFYGKMGALAGAGNTLKNNLIHNTNGQPFTFSGVDHTIELNETFNTGIEEGDGGVFYTGNSIWSFGSELRFNFIHHNMSVPGLLGKGGFHCDDFDAGEKIIGNIFYKGGWAGVKFNKSGGHTVSNNIFLEGFLGLRNNTYRQSFYDICIDFLENDPYNKSKPNYIGRMLQAIGKPDWDSDLNENNWSSKVSDYWKDRYPRMGIMFNKYQKNKNMHAYESRYYDNLFYNNVKGKFGVYTPGTTERGSTDITLDIFQNPNTLNFKFKNKPAEFVSIPFDKIGLVKDEYRCAVPSKRMYRSAVKQHFNNRPAHDEKAKYDPKTVNDILYYNSGKMVLDLMPCSKIKIDNTLAETKDEFLYDLGTPTSPVFEKYTKLTNINEVGIYSWTKLNDLKVVDRGNLNGANKLNRDFILGEGVSNTFVHTIPNGLWKVVVTMGDSEDLRDNMQIKAEGQTITKNVSTDKGQFKNIDFTVDIKDGDLNLEFADTGGVNNKWSVSRILLRNVSNTATLGTEMEANFLSNKEKVAIYPVPSHNILHIKLNDVKLNDTTNYTIFNSTGKSVKTEVLNDNLAHVDISNLANGLYFIIINDGTDIITKSFVKN